MIIVLYLCKGEMKMNKFLKGFVCALLVLSTGCAKEEKKETPKKTKKKTEETAQVTHTDITMSFVGDMTLGNYAGQAYDGSFDQEYVKQGNNPDYFLKNVKSVFEQDDLTIANLEGPLTDEENHVIKSFPFKGKKEYAKILTNSSVEAVTVANNHSMDRYQKGMDDTKATLDEYGVGYFGYSKSYIKEVKGIKFGFLGYAFPNAVSNDMKNAITELKKKTDFVIVYYHWGIERNYSPTQGQRDLAHATIDAGARPSAFDIAQEVWQAKKAGYPDPLTMGGALNAAGSAGDPWGTDVSTYPPGTAGHILANMSSAEIAQAIMSDPRLLTVAKFLGLK